MGFVSEICSVSFPTYLSLADVFLHLHDIRDTTVTMLAEARCTVPEIAAITGHSLRRAQEILDKYLSRTSKLAENAIAKFQENVVQTKFAKRAAKQQGPTIVK